MLKNNWDATNVWAKVLHDAANKIPIVSGGTQKKKIKEAIQTAPSYIAFCIEQVQYEEYKS